MSSIKHLCFDKDGTIIDVHCYWAHIAKLRAKALIEKYSINPQIEVQILDSIGIDPQTNRIKIGGPVGYHPRATILKAVLDCLTKNNLKLEISDLEAVFKQVDQYQQETSDYKIELLVGAKDFIIQAKNLGLILSVYSSDRKANSEKILKQLDLLQYFDAIFGGDSVKKPKPDPEGLLLACQTVGINPQQTAYVTDTLDDLRMANAAGAQLSIALETGLSTRSELLTLTTQVYPDLSYLNVNQFLSLAA